MKRIGLMFVVVLGLAASASAADKKVERLWKAKCSACHGMDGKGETEKGKKMAISSLAGPEAQKRSDADLKKAILEGVKLEKDGVKKEMDPYKDELKPAEVDGLVAFIRELGGKK